MADLDAGLLILDVSQWVLTATPTVADAGNYVLQLTGTDALGGTASTNFTLRVEAPPQITGSIPPQNARLGQTFNYFIPQNLFVDLNHDPLVFTASQANGQDLPPWLSFGTGAVLRHPANRP